MEIFCLHHMEWAVGNGSNVWQFGFGESIPGRDIWEAEAPARMEDLPLLLVGTIHSSILSSFQLQRQTKLLENKFPYPSSSTVMGRDAAGEDEGLWILPLLCFYKGCTALGGGSSQLSPDVGRPKNQLAFGLIHSHTVFFF